MPTVKTKILLVEYNDFIKDALKKSLEIEGYDVVTVKTALEGIKTAKKEQFDVTIADYELPDANGIEFFLLIRRFCSEFVSILMTTYGELKTMSDIYSYGITDAIEKPFSVDKLIELIEKNLQKSKKGQHGKAI